MSPVRSVVVVVLSLLSVPALADAIDPLGHAPAGVMFEHAHHAGRWMAALRVEEGRYSGYLEGDRRVDDAALAARGFSMRADSMDMRMAMLDLMWAPSDRLTLMLMPQYMHMAMHMVAVEGAAGHDDHGGHGAGHSGAHDVSGIGDTVVAGISRINQDHASQWLATLAMSAPTGDVDRRDEDGRFVHYGMQPGSGTWDALPSLTYTRTVDRWQWGAQAQVTRRLGGYNASGYRLGNGWQFTSFGAWRAREWLSLSARLAVGDSDAISGHYNGAHNHSAPEDLQRNYGGRVVEAGLGANAVFGNMRTGLEWRVPLHSDLNGVQLERDHAITVTVSRGF